MSATQPRESTAAHAIRLPPNGRPKTIASRIKTLESVLEVWGPRFDPGAVERSRRVIERTDARLRLGGQHTVVALAGATGSGKSSLVNALAGREVTEVAAIRPTTSQIMACVWGDTSAEPLLDWLGVPPQRRTQRESVLDGDREADLDSLILLDLPDHDSRAVHHRLEVDRMVEVVDLLVWVLDPQKYADDALHRRYLRRLVEHAGVMVVVLNQIDRLDADELELCRRDARRLLDADGLAAVPLLVTSATRGDGIGELRALIVEAVQARGLVAQRAVVDLRGAGRALLGEAVGISAQALPGAEDLVAALSEAAGVASLVRARDLAYRREARRYLSWPPLRWWRRLREGRHFEALLAAGGPAGDGSAGDGSAHGTRMRATGASTSSLHAKVDAAAARVAESVGAQLPGGWGRLARAVALPSSHEVAAALEVEIAQGQPPLAVPRWWVVARGVQALGVVLVGVSLLWLSVLGIDELTSLPVAAEVRLRVPLGALRVPLPLLLLGLGLAVGALLSLLASQIVARARVRRRADDAAALRQAVVTVAVQRVLRPLAQVVGEFRDVCAAVDAIG